jgi:hypothetical protein
MVESVEEFKLVIGEVLLEGRTSVRAIAKSIGPAPGTGSGDRRILASRQCDAGIGPKRVCGNGYLGGGLAVCEAARKNEDDYKREREIGFQPPWQ